MKTASAVPGFLIILVIAAGGVPENKRIVRIGPEMVNPLAASRDTDGSVYALDGGAPKQPARVFRMAATNRPEIFSQQFPSPRAPGGLMAWRGTVLLEASPEAWELRDTDGNGKADQSRVLLKGLGTDPTRWEHGLTGAVRGPDGRFYWAVGDAGVDATAREGYPLTLPDAGCVIRCNPDGSALEIYAHGLRDVRQLAFDEFGNLFGIDQVPGPVEYGRLLYIAEKADYGWRSYYGDRKKGWNPWRDEILTRGPEHPATVMPSTTGYSGKPASGLVAMPGGGLLVVPIPAAEPIRLRIVESGAGFRVDDEMTLETGIAASYALSASDGGLLLLGSPTHAPDNRGMFRWQSFGKTTRSKVSIPKSPAAQASVEELLARLAHDDEIVRADAQWELVARPETTARLLQAAIELKDRPLPLAHVLWALSCRRVFDRPLFLELIHSKQPEVRLQAVRWAGGMNAGVAEDLIPILQDPSLRVRYHAAMALGKTHSPDALEPLLTMLAENDNRDPWLQHAGVIALRGYWLADVLRIAREHPSAAVRLAAVASVADRAPERLSALRQEPDPGVRAETIRAMYQAKLPPNGPDRESSAAKLAWLLFNDAKDLTPGATRRALAAARLSPDHFSGDLLVKFIGNPNQSEGLRVEALKLLATWNIALKVDPLDGRPREIGKGKPIDRDLAGLLGSLIYGRSPALAAAARETATAMKIEPAGSIPRALVEATDANMPVNQRILAMELLARNRRAAFKDVLERLLRDGNTEIRFAAARLAIHMDPDQVAEFSGKILSSSSSIAELRQALALLMQTYSDEVIPILISCLDAAAHDRWPTEATLELMDSAEKTLDSIPDVKLAKSLAEFQAHLRTRLGKLAPFAGGLSGGDATRGRDIFENYLTARCMDCHQGKAEAEGLVPKLDHIGAAGRLFILESLVLPGEHLERAYATITVTRRNGSVVTGSLRMETSSSLTLKKPDGSEEVVNVSDIVARTAPVSPMPSSDQRLTGKQIRDLVEYLSGRQ
ncbi:HEAT repeat domain-containing protein [Luteolibacter ambystomatis]|uniref:HEAT repeat domain-containing protein n=1 Tax=Luteolibacter ambystomatis TaxID=2824561 RepID=A0A975PGC3_9BACT|nr:HEAT repeat domain-containing protein [Luteolibacter ambystomatis]QUE52450.1 HEAT repeat domain-containing protein [Luteolibacter ambystomatis]